MKVDFAFVCDYAEVAQKVNALGVGFDTIFAPDVPWKLPSFFFVIQLRANVVEAGDKNLEVSLIDEDGKDIIPALKTQFNIAKPPVGTESIARIALQFNNVEFPRYGLYSLHAVVEGLEVSSVLLKVSPPPQSG